MHSLAEVKFKKASKNPYEALGGDTEATNRRVADYLLDVALHDFLHLAHLPLQSPHL